jgi:hypothetical protein
MVLKIAATRNVVNCKPIIMLAVMRPGMTGKVTSMAKLRTTGKNAVPKRPLSITEKVRG